MKIVGLVERAVLINAQLRDFVTTVYSKTELNVMQKYLLMMEAYALIAMAKNHGNAHLYFRADTSIGTYYVYVAAETDANTAAQTISLYPAYDVLKTRLGIHPLSMKIACQKYTISVANDIQNGMTGDIPFVHRHHGFGDDLVFLAQKDNAGSMVCTFQENVKLVHITDWNYRQFEKLLDCQYPPLSLDTTRFWLIQ